MRASISPIAAHCGAVGASSLWPRNLFTTAAGLLVAVPAVLLYNHFVRRMGVMLTIAENHARGLRLTLSEPAAADSPTSRVA